MKTYGAKIAAEVAAMDAQALAAAMVEPRRPAPRDNAESLLRGRYKAAARGRRTSGPTPYGYKADPDTAIAPDPAEAVIVGRIFKAYVRSGSILRVRRDLAADGVLTRRGSAWSSPSIAWILHNEVYIGRTVYGTVSRRGIHRPIIDRRTFNEAQALLKKNNRKK